MRYTALALSAVVTGAGEAVRLALTATTAGAPSRVCLLVPGEIAWDNCDCGQLAQTITEVYPSDTFPVPANDSRRTACGPNLTVARVKLSLVRCVRGPTDGDPPSCADLLADALVLESDRYVARTALACYLAGRRDAYAITDFAVGAGVSVGPQGDCAGVEVAYLVGLGSACCS